MSFDSVKSQMEQNKMQSQPPTREKPESLELQFGGSHYKKMGIEPVQYIEANGIGFTLGNAVKYITRHALKNGAVDLKKAIHFVVMDLERVYGVKTRVEFSDDDDVIDAEFDVVEDEEVNSDERDNLCFATAEEMVKKGFPKAICILDRDSGFYIDADMTTNAECVVSPYCKSEREAWNTALDRLLGVASAGAESPPQAGTEGKTAEQLVKEMYPHSQVFNHGRQWGIDKDAGLSRFNWISEQCRNEEEAWQSALNRIHESQCGSIQSVQSPQPAPQKTAKQIVLEHYPHAQSHRTMSGSWKIDPEPSEDDEEYISDACSSSQEAWQSALNRIQQSQCASIHPRTTINEHAIAP